MVHGDLPVLPECRGLKVFREREVNLVNLDRPE